jgi:hypothetical protein
MANSDKIIAYLAAHKNKYCDDCIENLCDIHPRQQVNQICNNMSSKKIETSHDICFNCEKIKTTRSIAQDYNESFICDDICRNIKEQSATMKKLQHIGFQKAGRWIYKSEKIDLELEEDFVDCTPVLYAFVVDDAIKYIGESRKTLQERMQRYKTPAKSSESGGTTNINNNNNIKKELDLGKSVEIYVFVDSGLLSYGGYRINLARGLETSIVEDLQPEWNK